MADPDIKSEPTTLSDKVHGIAAERVEGGACAPPDLVQYEAMEAKMLKDVGVVQAPAAPTSAAGAPAGRTPATQASAQAPAAEASATAYEKIQWFDATMNEKRKIAEQHGVRTEFDNLTFNRFYKVAKEPPPPPQPVQLPQQADLDDVMDRLSADSLEQNYIIGFYPCHKRNRIVIDVEKDQRPAAQRYLQKTFENTRYNPDELFVITEQKNKPKPIVGTGRKVSTLEQAELRTDDVERLRAGDNDNPVSQNKLHDAFGTIGCLAKDTEGHMYALTTKHCFNATPEQESRVRAKVISVMEGHLAVIGDSHTGLKGAMHVDTNQRTQPIINHDAPRPQRATYRNRAIDIAAVPLRRDVTERLDPHLMQDIRPYYREHQIEHLRDRVVIKHGAESGESSGRVEYAHYVLRQEQPDILTNAQYLMILPQPPQPANQAPAAVAPDNNNDDQSRDDNNDNNNANNQNNARFSRPGDSGSLVWDRYGKPVGLLACNWPSLLPAPSSSLPRPAS